MTDNLEQILLQTFNCKDALLVESIQELWSGYGQILRYHLYSSEVQSVVVKWIRFPDEQQHPRGWQSNRSHERKVKSYEVETAFYNQYVKECNNACRIAKCYASGTLDSGEHYLFLEDLDEVGYPLRKHRLQKHEIHACLKWLAIFHAQFMEVKPDGLWNVGTYWHLETRPDELDALEDLALKEKAEAIDRALNACPIQSLVHGDAKVANFCFSEKGDDVAAVDFQYVGGGCGMKDVAYFLGSCLDEQACERYNEMYLVTYFTYLREAMQNSRKPSDLIDQVEDLWRPLFPIAWTDFHRFIKGWSPGHWKINSYSEKIAKKVCKRI